MPVQASQTRAVLLAIPVGVLAAALAVLGAGISPLIPLAVGAAGALFVIAYTQPLLTIYAAIAALPLEFQLQEIVFFDLTPSKGLFIATAAGWVVKQLIHRKPLLLDTPLTLPLVAVILVTLPGLLIAQDKLVVFNNLATWIVMFCVFQAVVEANDPKFVRRLMALLVLVGIVLGIMAITDTSFQSQASSGGGNDVTNRATAGFGSPNVLGALLVVTILPAVCLFFSSPWWGRVVCVASAGVALYGLLLTSSRGALLGLAAGGLAIVTWRPVRIAVLLAVVVLAGLAFGGINPLGQFLDKAAIGERIESITTESAASNDPRPAVYRGTLEIIVDNPIFGVGANDYVSAARDYGIRADSFAPAHAHNGPLTIAADRGLLGLAVFTWLVIALGLMLFRGLRTATGQRRAILTALTAIFVATLAHNMVDYTLGAVLIGILLTLAGCAVVLVREGQAVPVADEDEGEGAPAPGRLRIPAPAASQPGV